MKGNIFASLIAALGLAKRRESGKMRHVKIGTRWNQEQITGELQYPKMQWSRNPADLMTKNVNRRTLEKMVVLIQQHFKEGWAENLLHLQTASG